MLKFFRKIRRKLIDEGNLKRYLFYSVGEILLVMIGILLALQVNNWNEANLQEKKEIQILLEIKQSLEGDLKDELGLIVEWYDEMNEKVELVKNVIQSGQHVTNDSIALIIGDALIGKWYFNLRTSAFENIKSVGIDLISNDTLRAKISNIYNLDYVRIREMSEDYDHYYNTQIIPFINKFFEGSGHGYRKQKLYPRNPEILLNDESIITLLWQLQQRRSFKQNRGRLAIPNVKRVISEITKEIERLQN